MAFGKAYKKGYDKGYEDGYNGRRKVNFGHALAAFPNIIDPTEDPNQFEQGYQDGYEAGSRDRNRGW